LADIIAFGHMVALVRSQVLLVLGFTNMSMMMFNCAWPQLSDMLVYHI